MVIQRSWKILSDTGSTSASSTEANRSPSGIQSSSDDSNCSIQTTHSLATSIASPSTMRLEVQSTQSTVQQSPVSVLAGVNVVSNTNATSTTPDRIKYVTTPLIAETMLQRLRQRLSCSVHVGGTGTTAESAMRSLELLRISIQQSFDHEADLIIKQYMENYFKPAFQNIKENLGQNVVSEEIEQISMTALKLEYRLWCASLSTIDPTIEVLKLLQHCDATYFKNIHYLLTISATLPVTTASVERTFSTLKIIKTLPRSVMGNERLSALAVFAVHWDIKIDPDEVINDMANKKKRKILLI